MRLCQEQERWYSHCLAVCPPFGYYRGHYLVNLHYESPSNICKQQQHKKVGSLFYCEPERVTQNWIKELLIDYIVHGNGSPCQYHEPHDLNNSQGCELILQWGTFEKYSRPSLNYPATLGPDYGQSRPQTSSGACICAGVGFGSGTETRLWLDS